MSTLISTLKEDAPIVEEKVDSEDPRGTVMDLSNTLESRLEALAYCYKEDENQGVELLNTLCSMYQLSGISILERFLVELCCASDLPAVFRLEAAHALLEYEEFEDDDNSEDQNEKIRESNRRKQELAARALGDVCTTMEEAVPTPCRVQAICSLMAYPQHKDDANTCFKKFVNDMAIECEFRYKMVLSLESLGSDYMVDELLKQSSDEALVGNVFESAADFIKREFPKFSPETDNLRFFELLVKRLPYDRLLSVYRKLESGEHPYEFFTYESQLAFLNYPSNMTTYRILAAQYLLLRFSPSEKTAALIQNHLLLFARDQSLDYNLRADAADVLMQLGNSEMRDQGQRVIMELGRIDGPNITIFDNAQNVHSEEVEESVAEALEFLTNIPLLKINGTPITLEYVVKQIANSLKETRKEKEKCPVPGATEECSFCSTLVKDGQMKDDAFYCSTACSELYAREYKIKIALQRIELDRALYSKFTSTLSNILLKVWTYLIGHDNEEEMQKRLLEELEEMSGTCSSGFASRLINVISGFAEFGIRISWEDQITGNFTGRLNAMARKITDSDSLFHNRPYLIDVVALWLVAQREKKESKGDVGIIEQLKVKIGSNVQMQDVVEAFLADDSQRKIEICVEAFAEKVLDEMTVSSSVSSERQHFALFFRSHVAGVREEMYQEFKEYMDDTDFDLYMRKAVMHYEGL